MKILLLLVSAALLSGCGLAPPQQPPAVQRALHSEVEYSRLKQQAIEQALAIDPVSGQSRFVGHSEYVILSNFQFTPSLIRLKSGTITRIRLSNIAWVTHYFGGQAFFQSGAEVVNLLGAMVPSNQHHIPVSPFTERDIYLFVKDPGEYPLSCFVPNHRNAGMVGQLIVESDSASPPPAAVE